MNPEEKIQLGVIRRLLLVGGALHMATHMAQGEKIGNLLRTMSCQYVDKAKEHRLYDKFVSKDNLMADENQEFVDFMTAAMDCIGLEVLFNLLPGLVDVEIIKLAQNDLRESGTESGMGSGTGLEKMMEDMADIFRNPN